MSQRVLIIAYYFPPLGMSGVQRISKFAKYLPESGWDVSVLTIRPGSYFAFDSTLLEELERPEISIYRTRSLDPTRLAIRRRVGLPGESKRKKWAMLSQTIFQPDNKIGWYPFAVREGMRILEEKPHHAILSSAPPYTAHLVGAKLARKKRLPLILDYRDDWLDNPRHMYPTAWHRKISARMERRAFLHTNATVSINREIAHRVRRRSDGLIASDRHLILPHGFDPDDCRHDDRSESDDRMRIVYTGVFYDAQTPEVFLRGLARFLAVSPNRRNQITAQFFGLLPRSAHRLIKELGLSAQVDFRGYVPHSEAVRALREAHVLWMTIGRRTGSSGISTGKLYEYFGARKPILGLVPHGVARDSLVQYEAAELTEPDDPDAVAVSLGKLFAQWESGTLPVPNESFVLEHDRRELALKLSRILNNEPMSGTA